ncbi:amino acid permease-domain-containing protein [Circinella umbellata]|nr:amino acid permease-domain-containing protein [Circinella umbellata]
MSVDSISSHQTADREEAGVKNVLTAEEKIMAELGYKQLWGDAMLSGGSIAIIEGFLLVAVFTFCVALSLAEICSAFPVTGGLYVWVSKLAPAEYVPIACYITGWFAITSTDLGLAQFLASVISISNPDYNADIYWQYGIFLVIVFIHGLINSVNIKYNGMFNQVSLFWHLIGTLMIVIVGLVLTPNKPSGNWVFTHFENHSGFSSDGYAFLLGLLQSQYTLSGFDSAAQMSEETKDAARNAPKGILYAVGTAGIFGLVFLLGVNFCVQDYQAQVVDSIITPQMTKVFLDGVGYKWTIVFTVIIMGAMFFCGSALLLGSSRLVYAFSRDNAMPFSSYLCRVNKKTKTPIYAVWGNVIFAAVIGILYILNETAFNAIVSVNTIASSLAYLVPIALRLTVGRKKFVRGPFHLGPFSQVINVVSCCWIIFTSCLFVCPTAAPITADNMNYACVPLVAVLGGSILFYQFRAKKYFNGPGKSLEPDPYLDENVSFDSSETDDSTAKKNVVVVEEISKNTEQR